MTKTMSEVNLNRLKLLDSKELMEVNGGIDPASLTIAIAFGVGAIIGFLDGRGVTHVGDDIKRFFKNIFGRKE